MVTPDELTKQLVIWRKARMDWEKAEKDWRLASFAYTDAKQAWEKAHLAWQFVKHKWELGEEKVSYEYLGYSQFNNEGKHHKEYYKKNKERILGED